MHWRRYSINAARKPKSECARPDPIHAPVHDANGNLTQQNDVTYTWDSENRLLAVTPGMPAVGSKSLQHSYDGQQRRVTRTLREWTGSTWTPTETIHFIYDGWNVIEDTPSAAVAPASTAPSPGAST